MTKIPENKTRKRLRIVLCTLYLFEIFMCSMPFYQYISDNQLFSYSVFEMLAALGTGNTIGLPDSEFAAASTILPLNFIFVVIPIIGFFFCALDKQSNLKNIVSIFCCLFGVLAIMTIVTVNFLSLGFFQRCPSSREWSKIPRRRKRKAKKHKTMTGCPFSDCPSFIIR